MVTGEFVLWLDGDDVLRGGEHLRKLAAESTHEYVQYLFPYEYARDDAGNVTLLQMRERLMHPPHAQVWRSPVHEYCVCESNGAPVPMIVCDEVVVEHHSRQSTKQREPQRNLRILKNYVQRVGESDVRALYYIGVEYAAAGDIGNSLRYLKRYVQLADWDDEKCKALLSIGEHYRQIGDHDEAIRWTTQAMTTKSWPEPYFALGRSYYAMAERGEHPEKNYRRAAFFIVKGLEQPTDPVLFANPLDRFAIHAYLNVCFHAVGDHERALWSCEEGLKGLPGHGVLLNNAKEYRKAKARSAVASGIDELERLEAIPPTQVALLRAALKGQLNIETDLPAQANGTQGEPAAADAVGAHETKPEPGFLDVVLFLGPALERWTPETWAKTGMGGSETMAWEMARRLRKLGHRVRVYTDCTPAQEGLYENVEWLQWQRFRQVECDVLIASRFPWAVDDAVRVNDVEIGGCKATVRLLWVHDCHVGEHLDLRRAARFDRILCLSQWHKRFFVGCYQGIDADKVYVTRNGIDLARFDGTEERNPHRAVYSSSPDRGLLAAVMAWPKVREQVQDAELHVFYGFGNWEKSAQGDQAQLGQVAHLKQLCRSTAGVVLRDRVNQKQLAREFMRAGVWCYGTWFSETSCLTAMEAQAAGLHIVTSPIAALVETVGDRGVMLKEPWGGDSFPPPPPRTEFVAELAEKTIQAMHAAGIGPNEYGIDYAREHFGLDTLADNWSAMLIEMVEDMRERVVPAFKDWEAAE